MSVTKRVVPTLLMSAFLVAAATISLGLPRPAVAASFFVGGAPTLGEGEAVVELLAWMAIAGTAIAALVATVSRQIRTDRVTGRTERAALVLVAGLLVLGIAVVHRTVPTYTLCCGGDASHAREVIDLAR